MSDKRSTEQKRPLRRALLRGLLVAIFAFGLLVARTLFLRVYPYLTVSHPRAALHAENDPGYIPTAADTLNVFVSAPQAFVYDMDAGEMLWQKGGRRVVYPASITKLWSILTALQYLEPEEIITIGEEVTLIDPDSSLAYVQEGQRLRVDMLIEGMLLPSGNDAAYALAAAAGRRIDPDAATPREQLDAFIAEMNRYALACGLCGSTFTAPDGLAEEEHYTTIEDIVLICRMAAKEPLIARYMALPTDLVTYESGESVTWVNTNRLLQPDSPYYREGVVGMKTGSLNHNFCLIALYEREDGHRYLVGVLHAWDQQARFEDACKLVDVLRDGAA
jgi:D-alanyl-D-alanine carboxypeptidase (penicillin-binding protein 5/6)